LGRRRRHVEPEQGRNIDARQNPLARGANLGHARIGAGGRHQFRVVNAAQREQKLG
jgi:hypothetical protein